MSLRSRKEKKNADEQGEMTEGAVRETWMGLKQTETQRFVPQMLDEHQKAIQKQKDEYDAQLKRAVQRAKKACEQRLAAEKKKMTKNGEGDADVAAVKLDLDKKKAEIADLNERLQKESMANVQLRAQVKILVRLNKLKRPAPAAAGQPPNKILKTGEDEDKGKLPGGGEPQQ